MNFICCRIKYRWRARESADNEVVSTAAHGEKLDREVKRLLKL